MLTENQQEYFDTLLDLFQHDGWKLFIEEISQQHKSLLDNSPYICETNDSWQETRGQLKVLAQIANYQSYITQSMEQMSNDSF